MSGKPRQVLLEAARETSQSPGVYLMKDAEGVLLYVGKAKNLRNRVSTYFQEREHASPRTEMLVNRVDHFEVILTETESEALILENTLIKKHKPKFNVSLKDDKTYPYIRIRTEDDYPRLEWTRRVRKDGAEYFGPFPSGWAAKQVLQLLNETFELRDCSDNTFHHRSRPCILYQMGRCSAPCVGRIGGEDYRDRINEVIAVLRGRSDSLVKSLEEKMQEAAAEEEFEVAAWYRDQIRNLRIVTETQGAMEAGVERDRDVIAVARKDSIAHGALLQIRGGRLIAVRHFHLQNTDPSVAESGILYDFLSQYYLSLTRGAGGKRKPSKRKAEAMVAAGVDPSAPPAGADPEHPASGVAGVAAPRDVLVVEAPEDPDLLEKVIGVAIRVPESEVERQLVNVARANAQHALESGEKSARGHGVRALEEVEKKLHLERLPQRVECYDISNIQGQDAVASRVVFIDGAPDKNLYRRYKIRTVEGSNDFAMMREVLDRRFSRTDEELPDLVVVDGGKGQLAQAVAILEELNVQGVAVAGLAKARTERDFKSSDVKASPERVFIPGRKNPVPLPPHTAAYRLLTHVRDEAHRFAVSYHRLLRKKRTFRK